MSWMALSACPAKFDPLDFQSSLFCVSHRHGYTPIREYSGADSRFSDRTDVFRAETFAAVTGSQAQVLVVSRRFGVFGQIQGAKDGIIRSRHHIMPQPDDYAIFTQRQHRFNH
jgi:hypothetical protein